MARAAGQSRDLPLGRGLALSTPTAWLSTFRTPATGEHKVRPVCLLWGSVLPDRLLLTWLITWALSRPGAQAPPLSAKDADITGQGRGPDTGIPGSSQVLAAQAENLGSRCLV